jgi:DNA polymerase-3 subunit epsilon
LSSAPTFREIAGWLVHLFDRRPVITHNANFDLRMLNQEFERAGLEFRISQAGCTLMATGQRLALACADIGHELIDAHSALADARGALAIARSIGADFFLDSMGRTPHTSLEASDLLPRTLSRSQVGLTDLVDGFRSLPRRIEFEGSPIESYYLAFLDEVLDDMTVTAKELADLNSIAGEAGLSSDEVTELHRTYLAYLEQAALRDGRITPEEMDLITQFAALIGVDPTVDVTKGVERTELRKDLLICATGTALIDGREMSKNQLSRLVEEHGHRFTDNLTKKAGVNLLLVDSYGTQSGKAQQALRWGIPVMSVADYLGKSR